MVRPPKNIQWWWSPQKPLKICNGLFTFLDPRYVDLYALEEDVLQRIVEDISRCYLIFHSSLKYLDMILSSFGDMILTRDSIVNLKTIVDHCPQNFENHRKTIGSNGWTPKKHSMVMVQLCQNHWKTIDGNGGLKKNINHSIALKNWPSLWSMFKRYSKILKRKRRQKRGQQGSWHVRSFLCLHQLWILIFKNQRDI